MNRGQNRFVGPALLDLLVKPFFDENPFQGAKMELVL